ncbi:MAG TPA: MarR family transcriptional regulator [Candidatus Binataceae bacterium]|nr:MarR family transcriptional regulator [Candidatus Binataceae bacterium]
MGDETKHIGRECIGFRVRMLNRLVTSFYDDALSKAGVKTSQFNVLVAVSNRGAIKPSELAKILAMDESTMSRNVERMCAKGWLRLEADEDRRSHRVTITERGTAIIRKGYPAWQKAQEEVSRLLGAENVAALRSSLKKLHA